ncbi:UDP-3-O-(3-hydroxymyristoyl)glucosamine N-acyltransferase [Pelagibacteraceae bacterium]|nr:UDP-3-O-(3-hydroxymyristoyl)glucosamine N-acyltransferase [Pelagibacteraceae bacterium]
MSIFFENKGPIDINKIIKAAPFSQNIKLKKKFISNISNLKNGKRNEISFFVNKKYINDLNNSNVTFCFIKKNDLVLLKNKKVTPIISEDPLLDFIITAKIFYPDADNDRIKINISKKYSAYKRLNTIIDKSVKIGKNFSIGSNSLIKKNVIIGNNVVVGSNCVISNAVIQDNVIINDGSVIGKIGFGFKYIKKKFHFIPHIGCVMIESNVYIGSNCTIDRGSFSNTKIGESTKIDNQVHIAHNVEIGKNCYLVAQVGIAGSSKIGNNCMVGGQVGISGHLNIGNNVYIGGKSGVIKNVGDKERVMGYPAKSIKNFLKDSKKND